MPEGTPMDAYDNGTPSGPLYEWKELEEDVIKYICERIVAMREQPFIDAVDNWKRAQELNNL